MNIRLFKPSLDSKELNSVKRVFKNSWIGLGPQVSAFENAWKRYLRCNEAIALNSGTAALHLAIRLFKFPAGKKVLVPSLSFSSTASAVLYNNLVPIFVDSDPITLGMDLKDLDNKYDKNCVAVIPVHYAGHPIDMQALINWTNIKKLKVIEDCAHTVGSKYLDKPLGLWGDIGCFSFEEKKIMTTGDGGMICSNDKDLLKEIKAMRWVGIDRDTWKVSKLYTKKNKNALHWFYEINILGYKYNMNDLAASIGLVQLKKLGKMIKKRSEIIKTYLHLLRDIKQIKPLLPYRPEKFSYWMFGIRTEKRNELIIKLKSLKISTGCHYTPLSLQPLFKKWGHNCPYIEKEANKLLTLPLHVDLSKKNIEFICSSILNFFKKN
jgi:perosamine synthetase